MGIKFNPLLYSGFQFDLSGAPYFADPVATEADLPIPDTNGAVRAVLSTHELYIWDDVNGYWKNLGIKLEGSFGSTPNDEGISILEIQNGDSVLEHLIQLQPADVSHPGSVSIVAQEFGGDKTFNDDVIVEGVTYSNDLDSRTAGGTLALGASNASIINIGRSGATVNVIGTTNNINVTNYNVTDKNLTINDGGSVGSASDAGVEVEENAVITAYIKTSGDRNSWRLKSPALDGEMLFTPSSSAFNNVWASSVLSATRTYTLPDISGTLVLTEGNQTINGDKTLSGTTNLSALTASTPLKLDASKNIISSDIDLTTDVTAILPIANGGTNSNTALNNNRVMRSSGGAIVEASAITADRALISDANGIPTHSVTTNTELSYVNGVTSAIQTQLNNKQPLDSTLTALAAYNTNGLLTQTAADTFTGRSIAGGTGVSITNGDGVAGNPTVSLDSTLVSLAGYNTNGLLTQTAADTFVGRTITAGTGISVSNGDGVSGNPTITNQSFVTGDLVQTTFSGANNQIAASDVTGFAFSNASVRSFDALVSVTVDATSDLFEVFKISAVQRGADWQMSQSSSGDTSGVVFSITNSGQVQYISSNYAGFSSLTMKIRADVTSV